MTMSQHEARERFLTDHINMGARMLRHTLADANATMDALVDHEDDAIALRQAGDVEGAMRAAAMHADARARHQDLMAWADTLSEQLGGALLRLATGSDDL